MFSASYDVIKALENYNSEKYPEALDCYRVACKQDKTNPDIWEGICYTLFALRFYKESLRYFLDLNKELLKKNICKPNVPFTIGCIYTNLYKDDIRAWGYLRDASIMAPNDQEIVNAFRTVDAKLELERLKFREKQQQALISSSSCPLFAQNRTGGSGSSVSPTMQRHSAPPSPSIPPTPIVST